MKRLLIGCALMSLATLPVLASLNSGDKVPEFTAQASFAGKSFSYSLKDELKKGPVVVYFYPSAYTGGCNIQAHTFAESSAKFKAAGASIVGVSLDSIERLNDFSKDPNYCAGKFPTASDPEGAIAKSFGVAVHPGEAGQKDSRGMEIGHGFADRTTFIVKGDGTVAASIGGIAPAENVEKALAAVQSLSMKK